MKFCLLILTLISSGCTIRSAYQQQLSGSVDQIRDLINYDNSFVVYDESTCFGSDYPGWNPEVQYFTDDPVTYGNGNCKLYLALKDNKGKKPSESPDAWSMLPNYHPYLFLRDTAKIEDLRKLVTDENPILKTYAFGALVRRTHEGLFPVILSNLDDQRKFMQMTGHVGSLVYPADLMISYAKEYLSPEQKTELSRLIKSRYPHLNELTTSY